MRNIYPPLLKTGLLTFLLWYLLGTPISAQVNFCTPPSSCAPALNATANIAPNSPVCTGTVLTLTGNFTPPVCNAAGYVGLNPATPYRGWQNVPFSMYPVPVNVMGGLACDDCTAGPFPIGFNFDYACQPTNQFWISSNGMIFFGLAGVAPNFGVVATPNAANPNHYAGIWTDLNNNGNPGNYRFETQGVAPCRRLVVQIENVPFFGGGGPANYQIILHEGSNAIEIQIQNMTGGGNKMLGTENVNGSGGYSPAGRNAAFWNANNEGWILRPTAATYQTQWSNSVSGFITNNLTANVNALGVNSTYTFFAYDLAGQCTTQVDIPMNVNPVPANPGAVNGNANVCAGFAQAYNVANPPPLGITYTWSLVPAAAGTINSGQGTQAVNVTWASSGTLRLTASNACGIEISDLFVTVSNPPSNPGAISGTANICQGSNANYSVVTPPPFGTTYTWSLIPAVAGTINSGQGSELVNVTWNSSGTLRLTASAAGCAQTFINDFNVTVTATPTQPAPIFGNTNVCTTPAQRYIIPPAPNTTYFWTVLPLGPTITNINSPVNDQVDVLWNAPGTYTLSVQPIANGCAGPARTLTVTVTAVPAQPGAITGSINLCPGGSSQYAVVAVPNTNSYNWEVTPSLGVAINGQGSNVVNISYQNAGIYTVSVNGVNGCGNGVIQSMTVEVTAFPARPTILVNTSPICPGRLGAEYSVVNVPNTVYNWTVPPQANIIAGFSTDQIFVNWANNTPQGVYFISATPVLNGCTGTPVNFPVFVNPGPPAQPGAISGNTPVCPNQVANYAINAVPNATTYFWSGFPGGVTITAGQGTRQITVNWGNVVPGSYVISVEAINGCGTSPAQSYVVTVPNAPSAPSFITPPIQHCVGSIATYTTPAVMGATSYTWTNSCGWSGSSNTNSIDYVATSTGPCTITVSASNGCFTSASTFLTVNATTPPSMPSAVSGRTIVCRGAIEIYSVTPVAGETYTWTGLPFGASVTSGQGTSDVVIDWGTANAGAYIISVTPSNVCGTGQPRRFPVTIQNVPNQPSAISGIPALCQNGTATYTITPVNGVTYMWSVNPTGPVLSPNGSSVTVTWVTAGSYVLSVTPMNNCGAGTPRNFTVNVTPTPVVDAGIDQTVCGATTTLIGTPNNGTWSCEFCPGGASIQSFGPIGVVSGLVPDASTVFKYQVNDPTCGLVTDYVLVRNDQVTPGQVVNGNTVCSGSSGVVTLVGYTPTATIVRWESSIDNFVSNIDVINNITPTYAYVNASQTIQYRAVLQLSGICPETVSGHTTVTVVQDQTPVAAPTTQTVCDPTATLIGTLPISGTGQWMFIDGPSPATVATNNGIGLVSGMNQSGDYTFRWNIVNAPCPNRFIDVLVRRVSGVVQANAGANQRVCTATATVNGNNPQGGTGVWSFISGPAPANITTVGVSGLIAGMIFPGDYVFEWHITEPNCNLNSASTVMVTVAQPPTVSFAGTDQDICSSTATLTGNVPLIGTPSWTFVSGPMIPNLLPSGNTALVVNLNLEGQYVFRYTIDNPGCPPSVSEVRINKITQELQAQVVNVIWNTCSPDFSVQAVAPPNGVTGTWSFVSGPSPAAIFTQGTVGNIVGMALPGEYVFSWEIGNPLCGTSSILVSVFKYDDIFPAAFAGANQQWCERSTALLNGSVPPAGATATWRFVNGPVVASLSQFGTFASVVNMSAPGDYVFSYTVQNSGCAPSVAQVTVTRVATPTVAQAGPSGTICGTSVNLVGNVPIHGVNSWTLLSSPGGNPNLNYQAETATLSNITVPGQYVVRYTIDNPPCSPSHSDVYLTVNPMSDAGTLSSSVLTGCAGANAGTLTLANYMGNIVRWEVSTNNFVSLDIIPVTTNTLSFVNLTQTTSYRAIVKQGTCPETISNAISIDITPIPPVANGGADFTICGDNTLLRGNNPNVATNMWLFNGSSNGVVPNVQQSGNDAIITGMNQSGDYFFQYFIFNACGFSVDDVTVSVNAGSVPGLLSADATVCKGNNNGTLNLAGFSGNILRWEYSTNNFQTFSVIPNTTPAQIYNNLTQTTFYRAIVQDGICPVAYSNVVQIQIITPVVANAGIPQTVCSDRTTLIGNDPAPDGIPTWSQVAGTPVPFSQSGVRADVSGLTPGTYTFRYTLDFGGFCPQSISDVMVTVSNQTLAGQVDFNTSICSGGNATLNLTGYQGNIVRWERSTNEWNTVLTILNTTPTLNATNLTTTTAYRAVVKSAGCDEATSLEAVVYVFQPGPAADAGIDQILCQDNTLLKGNAPDNGIPTWRFISGPAVPLIIQTNENALLFNLGVGTTVMEYEIDRGPCGITTDQVSITVLTPANAGFLTGGTTVCNTGTGTLTLSGQVGNIIRWEQSYDNFITVQPIVNTNPTYDYTNVTRTTAYRAVVSGGICGDVVSNPVLVVVENGNFVADGGFDQSICGSFTALVGNMPNMMIGTWSVFSAQAGSNPILVPNGSEVNISGLTVVGTYVFRYTLSNVSCPVSFDDVTVTVLASSVAGNLTPNLNAVCEGTNTGIITLTGQVGNVVRWESSMDNFVSVTTIANTNTSLTFNNLTRTTQFRAVVLNGSCGNSVTTAPVTVNVDARTVGGEVLFNQTVCSGTNGGTLTLVGYVGTILRWESSLDGGTTWSPIVNNAPSQGFVNLVQNTTYRAVVQNGTCLVQNSGQVTVFVAPPPVAGTLGTDAVVCQFNNNGTLSLTGQTGHIARWEASTDPNFLQNVTFVNTSLANLTYSGLSQTTYYRALVGAPNCNPIFTNVVTITVVSPATSGTVTADATVCSGNNAGTLTLSGQIGNVVNWESSSDCINFTTTIANVSNILSYNNLTGTTCYRAVVSNGICVPTPSTFARITVQSPPVAGTVTGGTSVCLNGNSGMVQLTGQNGSVVRWESSNDCAFFSNPVSIPNTNTIQGYVNLTQTTCYRAIVQNGVCAQAVSNFETINVVADPNPGFIVGNVGGCAGQTSGILSLVTNTAPVIRWEISLNNVNWTVLVVTNATNIPYTNLNQTTYYRAVVQLSNCPEIVSPSVAVVVTPAPIAGTLTGGGNTVCFGNNSGTLTLTGNNGFISRWETSTDNGLTWNMVFVGTNTFNYANLTQTTRFRAVVQSGECNAVFSNNVVVTVAPPVTVNAASITGCAGSGSITAIGSGGSGNGYVYTLLPVGLTNQTGQFNSLPAGTYTVQVRDNMNCTGSVSVTISATPTPTYISNVSNISSNSALITWANAGAGTTYNLRYRILGSTTWTLISGLINTSFLLTGLQNNTTYEVQVQYICPGGFTSPFSTGIINQFTTLPMGTGDCLTSNPLSVPIPGGIYISSVTNTTALVHWNLVNNSAGYIISYGRIQDNPNVWPQFIVCHPTNSFLMNSLQPNTQYRVRLRTNCSNCTTALNNNDIRSNWSNSFDFNTPASMEQSTVNVSAESQVMIYPNPTKGSFTIAVSGEVVTGTAEVFDLTGRKVATKEVNQSETQMSLEGLTSGVYTLRLRLGSETKVMKVILE